MSSLVLLPGLMCDERLFAPQIKEFSNQLDLLIGDITGHDTIEGIAKDVLQQAPSSFCLAGLSMGGIVAMEVVRQAPTRVQKLALLDTSPLAELDEIKERRNSQIAKVLSGGLLAVMRDELKPFYVDDVSNKVEILSICMEMAMKLGPQVFKRQSHALQSRPDQQATLRKIAVPTLVLCGEHDQLCSVAKHQLMHSLIPNSKLVIIKYAGHLTTLEQPEKVNRAFSEWLN